MDQNSRFCSDFVSVAKVINNSMFLQGHKSNQEMLQNILVTFVLFSVNVQQGECTTVDLFKIPDPNKPCHLEIVKSKNNHTDHSGSRVIDTDVKSQLISTHLLFSITKTVSQNFNS